jgi:hypothetical protein
LEAVLPVIRVAKASSENESEKEPKNMNRPSTTRPAPMVAAIQGN